jgi:hypothetical protein
MMLFLIAWSIVGPALPAISFVAAMVGTTAGRSAITSWWKHEHVVACLPTDAAVGESPDEEFWVGRLSRIP